MALPHLYPLPDSARAAPNVFGQQLPQRLPLLLAQTFFLSLSPPKMLLCCLDIFLNILLYDHLLPQRSSHAIPL